MYWQNQCRQLYIYILNSLKLILLTAIPFVYFSVKNKKEKPFLITLAVDISIEISNISFSPREFEFIVNAIELISKPKKLIILGFHY